MFKSDFVHQDRPHIFLYVGSEKGAWLVIPLGVKHYDIPLVRLIQLAD